MFAHRMRLCLLCSVQSGYSPSPELGELLEADSYGSLVLSRLCIFSGNITDPADARFNLICRLPSGHCRRRCIGHLICTELS